MDTETVAQGPQGTRANLDWTEANGKFVCLVCNHDGIDVVTATKTGMLSHFRAKHRDDHPVGWEDPNRVVKPGVPNNDIERTPTGRFLCPECKAEGIIKEYEAKAGLGSHRKMAHGIAGTSPAVLSMRYRDNKKQKPKPAPSKPSKPVAPPTKLKRGETGLPLFDSQPAEKPVVYNTKKNQLKIKILGFLADSEMTLTELNRKFGRVEREKLQPTLKQMAKEGLVLIERRTPRGVEPGRGRISTVFSILGPGQQEQSTAVEAQRTEPAEDVFPCFYCPMVFNGRDARGRTRHIKIMHPGLAWDAPTGDQAPLPEHLQTSNIVAATNARATLVIPQQQPGRLTNGIEHLDTQNGHFITDDQLAKIQAEWRAAGYLERTLHDLAHQQNEAGRDFTKRSAEILLYLAKR